MRTRATRKFWRLYVNPLGYTGEEAEEYITTWTENTVNALTTAGMIE